MSAAELQTSRQADGQGMRPSETGGSGGPLFSALVRASAVCCALPERASRWIAGGLGLLVAHAWRSERERWRETIDRIYHRCRRPPPLPVETIIEQGFLHFALVIAEVLRFPAMTGEDFQARVTFEGLEHLRAAMAGGRGVVLAVPHLGNWELLGGAIAHAGFPLHSFYMAQKEDDLGRALDHFRQFTRIVLHDRDRGLVGALKALKQGAILGMMPDQDGGNHGVFLDFLGHWVSVPAGPANWSLKTGAAVVPLYSWRCGRSRCFRARFLPALPAETASTMEERVISRTRRLVAWMEEVILALPHQYLWFYDRFKPRHHQHLARLKKVGVPMRGGGACLGLLPGEAGT